MTLIILLYSLGILLLVAEVLVPGGVIGTVGAILMFIGCVIAFVEYGSGGGLLALLAGIVLAVAAFFIEFRVLPNTRLGRRAFLTKEMTGVSAAIGQEARNLIGKSAEALTMLSPSGYVRVDGRRYEAFCQSGQAPVGSALEVIGADSFRLIVIQTPVAS
jgi:membrane-bound ClpP family serine protease